MPRKDNVLEDPKAQELYLQCLDEIPLWKDVPRGRPKTPPAPFYPRNFDELYAARKELQAGKLVLLREPRMQAWYTSRNDFFDQYQKQDPSAFHPFRTNMQRDLEEQRVMLRENPFHYQVPEEDTAHNLLWYLKGVSRQERARFLSGLLFQEGLVPGDFMVIRNPRHLKSVFEFPHDHVYSRIKPENPGIFTPFLSLIEISMAFAGEPGYTLERVTRRFR